MASNNFFLFRDHKSNNEKKIPASVLDFFLFCQANICKDYPFFTRTAFCSNVGRIAREVSKVEQL